MNNRRIVVRISARAGDVFLYLSFQTGCGFYPHSRFLSS